jgi:16S rRNA (uracil1498-N3)-methyltransferase
VSIPVFVLDGAPLRAAEIVTLDGDEGRHAAVVRRIRAGEEIELTDGAGHVARCLVVESGKSGLVCQVTQRRDVPRPEPRITVVQALAKGDRGELAVETMTEVGVDEIIPWAARRSITQWKAERGAKALGKWRATAREAAKQSRRAWHPTVSAPASTGEVAERLAAAEFAAVLHEQATLPIGRLDLPVTGEIVLVVGPEGGIDDAELAAFTRAGAASVRMGPTVLRTSTAGAVAAGVILAAGPRWESPPRQ